jgi:uncharacterized membrane protein
MAKTPQQQRAKARIKAEKPSEKEAKKVVKKEGSRVKALDKAQRSYEAAKGLQLRWWLVFLPVLLTLTRRWIAKEQTRRDLQEAHEFLHISREVRK